MNRDTVTRMTLLVVGARGTVGREIVKELVHRGENVRVATRQPSAIEGLRAVCPVEFDFDKPELFPAAVHGVDRVFLMARPGEDHPDTLARPLLAAMRGAGVSQVVNLTGFGVEQSEQLPLRQLELELERSELRWTHLRPNYFMQNLSAGPLARGIRERNEIALPLGDACISFVDARDIAAVAVDALCSTRHDHCAYDITGEESVGLRELAQAISSVTRREIRYRRQTHDEAYQSLIEQGSTPARAARSLQFMALARTGALSRVSTHVREVLHRPAASLRAFVNDHAHTWNRSSLETHS